MEPRGKAVPRGTATSPESAMASELFDQFVSSATFKSVLHTNRQLCELLRLKPTAVTNFYPRLKAKLHSWRAASLWAKLDKRASHKCYNRGKACPNTRVLIIGAGPCGLRTAIEAQLLGAKVVVVEKRDRFSRNNVLHLWPFVIHDLRNLGAKKFFGKFCAGSIDHISIRQLQIILLKVALLLGVEVHENVGFESLIEPPEDQHERIGWRAEVSPADHPVSQYEFDVLIGADGKRNTLLGFNRKEFRGKLAIAVTANFINRHSPEEARGPEISGVAFIFNQKFFQDMKEQTSIDLENIVYYKDDTHYFVMTAKKQSLLERGVIIKDYNDTARLLAAENVDREALMEYARDAADFATSYQLPHLDFAVNHYGQADVAMFDFTSMYAAENACRVIERRGHKLLQGLVGDSLLEPFWPTGSGCARGFLSAFDAAWMIRSWASGKASILQVLAERESIYRLLAQTTPENLSKDLNQYTLNPSSRYPNLNLSAVLPFQVRSLYATDGKIEDDIIDTAVELPKKKRRRESMIHPDTLLNWCRKQVALSDKIKIQDFTTSWKDGLALCTVLHHYRPDLIDINKLDTENVAQNNQLAFDICEKELGIPPVMTGQEMAECAVPDKLTMVSYISQVYESFRGEIPVVSRKSDIGEERTASPSKQFYSTPLSILNKVSNRLQNKRKYSVEKEMAKDKERGENVRKRSSLLTHKRRSREKAFGQDKNQDIILTDYKSIPMNKPRESINTRVRNLEEKMKKDAGLRCHVAEESDNIRTPHVRSEQADLNIKMLQKQLQNNGNEASVKKNKAPKVGKLRKDEWNVKIIEEKIKQQSTQQQKNTTPDKPKVYHEIFASKLQQMNEKLKAGGTLTPEEEARYKKFDASLTRLKDRLSKGNLEVGDRGKNQIAAMTDHMTKIWDLKQGRRKSSVPPGPVVKGAVETDSQKSAAGSTVCYFCKERVYLLERLSAEGLFFHRTCFKCEYCNTALRLGDYSFDKDSGGKFYCKPHFRMQKTDLRQQEIMKRKEAFLSCALENDEKEKLYKILLGNAEKALSPRQSTETAKSTPEDTAADEKEKKKEVLISPANLLAEPPNTIPRDQTPERVEYENSIIEMSEDELLVSELEEEELTQKNLGPSQDLATSEDDYSDLSTDSETDEEAFAEELERSLTADETRKLAETWNRKYSAEQSLIYSDLSSSADDEGSDTEIGSDDTSQDIDSDAEYSIEHDEEDDVPAEQEVENPAMPKTPEEKEFTMEVPIIDLKSMNRASEDDTSSDSDSKDITDSEGESDDETGTEVDSESESESESNPLPPPQIPTIVIYESPPQNPELDQEWNENAASEKAVPCAADNTIVLSSDTSAANSGDEQTDAPVEAITANVDPSETIAEAASAPDDRNADGKFTQLSDMDKNLDSPCSRVDFDVSVVEILEAVSSPDLESPLKFTAAPLATGESSSDLSVSSDIESLAQDIVSGVLKAAQDSILQRLLTNSIDSKKETAPEVVQILIDEIPEKIVCSQPVETPVIDLVTPEKPDDKEVHKPEVEEIDLCSPVYQVQKPVLIDGDISDKNKERKLDVSLSRLIGEHSETENLSLEELAIAVEEKPSNEKVSPLEYVPNEELETKSGFVKENQACQVKKPDVIDTLILDDSNEFSVFNESPEDSKNITFRKKNTSYKNDTYEWDSDKSISFPGCYYEEEDVGVSVDDFVKKDGSYHAGIASVNNSNTGLVQEEEECIPELKKVVSPAEEIKSNSDITKPSNIATSCLSQSLPNNSSSFLTGMSFPKTVSYNTSAEFENAKLESTEPKSTSKEGLPAKLSKETCYSRFADDIMSRSDSSVITSTVSKQETSGLNTSKEETKYKGYSGSFAEKVRPKSLFSDAIYLRSLDIKLQKQPFPSLNKSDDKLDECCKSEEDHVRRKLFGDNNKSIELDSSNIIISTKTPISTAVYQTPSSVTVSDGSCLKHKTPLESSDKLSNLSKQKISGHKHSSVSFSSQDSYTDLVSPYTCVQAKTPADKSFPTKVKPKCDMDISKLRQRREKRKSVHEDIQGLPFADEEKLMSPVDPIGSSDVFLTPKELSKPDLLSNVHSSVASKTPDLIDEDRYLRVQSTVDQEKARQEARARARLKSDEELGLSPNNYRKKYRRQLSLNSINYDELCSDEFCDQDDELEDDVISNICQMKNTGIEDTFNMIKKTELCPRTKTPETPLASSQQFFQPMETRLPSTEDELFLSTDSLDVPEGKTDSSQKKVAPVIKPPKHSVTITSSSETSPDICIVEPSFDSKPKTKSKNSLLDGSGEEEKSKSNGKKSIFSILNFGKGNQSKEKARQKAKSSEKDLSSSLPNDIGARAAVKTKPFSNLKLSKSKEKCPKPKSKSVPPESLPTSPLENSFPQEESSNISFSSQLAKNIPKYTVYRNPETTISTFPVHLPVPKMENGLAPKASEDSFSDEDDTQGSRSGHFPSSEKADKSSLDKERRAQRIVQKVQRQQVLKRLRNAQEIKRRLEEVEIQQKEIEQQGVEVEKMLRGEGNRRGKAESELMQEWYTLNHTKNKLTREVQEHLIRLKDLELEDRQSRLQQDFAQRMAEGSQKNATQLIEERKILDEMLKIVDQRNELVAVLEQLRLREDEEEKTITTSDVFTKGIKSPISSGEKS